MAVGTYDDKYHDQVGGIAVLSSGRWTTSSAPLTGLDPASDPAVDMSSIACPTATYCVAVGGFEPASGGTEPLVETFYGGRWAPSSPSLAATDPAPSSPLVSSLSQVSCAGDENCVAIGSYASTSGGGPVTEPLLATLAGGSWSTVTAPTAGLSPTPESGTEATLGSVSCSAAGSCAAAGVYLESPSVEQIAFESDSTGAWADSTVPLTGLAPAAVTTLGVSGLACPESGSCVLLSTYQDASGSDQGMAELLSGGRWTASTIPLSGLDPTADSTNPQVQFAGLSCTAPSACVAVGNYVDSTGATDAIEAILSGTTWTAATASSPATGGSALTALDSVACSSAESCSAVGIWTDNTLGQAQGLIATLADGRWTTISAPVAGLDPPADTSFPSVSMSSVSCASATFCAAVGAYSSSTASYGLTETLREPSSLSISITPDATSPSRSVKFSAEVRSAAAPPAGSVSFSTGSKLLCTAALTPSATTATGACSSTTAPLGSNDVVAAYTGSADLGPSTASGRLTVAYPSEGYWLATATGGVFAAGAAPQLGGTTTPSADPVAGIAATPDGGGYWLVTLDGAVIAKGDARFYGDPPDLGVDVDDIVAIAPTGDGGGYWLIGSDGGEFAFGDAHYHGSLPGLHVHTTSVVGMVATSDGGGYWLVGSDGGIFALGDARYVGSLPGLHVSTSDICAMIPSPTRRGYVLVGRDGGAFVIGSGVHFYGSLPQRGITTSDIVGLALTPDTLGYWLAGADGLVYAFGDAEGFGEPAGISSALPVVAMAAT
jgi:hypothetical protein